jgi:MYXO-CTERM domain-containing protein
VLGAGLLPRLYGEDGQSGLAFALLGLVVLAASRRRPSSPSRSVPSD